jgi:hypothetical protein
VSSFVEISSLNAFSTDVPLLKFIADGWNNVKSKRSIVSV